MLKQYCDQEVRLVESKKVWIPRPGLCSSFR